MSLHGTAAILWLTVFLAPAIEAQSPGASREDPAAVETSGDVSGFDFSGIWQVRVEKLSIWAPRYTLNKTIGLTRWKLAVAGDDISVEEYSPDPAAHRSSEAPPDEYPFTEIEVTEVTVNDDFIAFDVKGAGAAYEHYRLEQFSDHEIVGTYLVLDRFGSGPSQSSEYQGRLILEKIE